jgi:hypothetical protein
MYYSTSIYLTTCQCLTDLRSLRKMIDIMNNQIEKVVRKKIVGHPRKQANIIGSNPLQKV